MTPNELKTLTLTNAVALLRTGHLSPTELIDAALERIDFLNARMNVFITVLDELARETARTNPSGWLAGVPIAIKDLFDTRGIRTTAGSGVFADRIPSEDAAVVRQMKEAGAIIIGKTNMHEFAYGTTNAVSHYGPARNPWDPSRVSGGSSGGSAAAISLAMALGAWGSDTGGSIRIPASLCGIVGIKPTYGLIPTQGTIPLSPSLDHCGPMALTVADVAMMLQIRLDLKATTHPIDRLRVGVPRSHFFDRVDPEILAAVQTALGALEQLGARIIDVDLPSAPLQKDVFPRIAGPEVYAYHRPLIEKFRSLYSSEILARIEAGASVQEKDVLDARRIQQAMKEECNRAFEDCDAIVTPTTPIPAPLIEQSEVAWPDGSTELVPAALTRFTRVFNITGIPAISVPCGFTKQGLPIGLQIAGRQFDERTVLQIAGAYERERKEGCVRPPM